MRIDNLLSPENIRRMINSESVGDIWPYAGGTKLEIESHIKSVVATLKRIRGLAWEANFNHYGSGYASYVDAFARRRDDHGVQRQNDVLKIMGLRLYISRVAPISCMGRAEVTDLGAGGGFNFLEPNDLDTLPDDSWFDYVRAIRQALVDSGYEIFAPGLAQRPLPFQAKIPTILSDSPHRFFDAAFFWED
jgi:hypothetical protein